jgi:uncharacterized membrane protein YeiH
MAREMRLHASPQLSRLQLLVSYVLCSLGGALLSSLLLGLPPGPLGSDRVCLCYLTAFCLISFEPFASRFLSLFSLPLLLPVLIAFQDIGFAHAITSYGLDRCLQSPNALTPTHRSFFAAILTALLSATGGGLLRHSMAVRRAAQLHLAADARICLTLAVSALLTAAQLLSPAWSLSFPHAMLSPPSLHVRLALLLSLLYYAATDPHGLLGVRLLGRSEARLLVIAAVVSQISGRRLLAAIASPAAARPAPPAAASDPSLTSKEEEEEEDREQRDAVQDASSARVNQVQRRRAGEAAAAKRSH